ncbi:helix-turn-helix domain-containing protein [Shewanella sp.]|uniref:helix-turn-helix domain-containing protein n=2 Tax=Shewanella sp. TaxID=50422 RepID=UPI0040473F8D
MQHHIGHQAPRKSIFKTTDVDQQAHNLTQWQQIYDQTSDGEFYGCIEGVTYPHSHVFKEFTQRALRQQCNIAPDSVWIGIPENSTESKINGLHVEKHQIMCRTSEYDFELITPEYFTVFGIVINRQVLQDIADIQGVNLMNLLSQNQARLAINPSILAQSKQALSQLLVSSDLGLQSQLQQDVINTIAISLLGKQEAVPTAAPSYKHRLMVVDKVKQFIEANPHQAITISQLCEYTHVSRRTLQYSFESILGINPLRFLRLTRFNNVRRELKQPAQDKTISVIAANWGFWHPGQFTKDYTQLFGENPSQTLKRHQK